MRILYCPKCKEKLGPLEDLGSRTFCPHCHKWSDAADVLYAVYKVYIEKQWCAFEHIDDALYEVKSLLLEDPLAEEEVKVALELMRLEDFYNMPEFLGW